MRAMAGAGTIIALVAVLGALFYWRGWLERWRLYLWSAVVATVLPFVAMTAGWVLTEVGRQPWIVQGLLKTDVANSPAVSTTWIVLSLTVFVALYLVLLVVDFWLMRRYAKGDPFAEPEEAVEAPPVPAF
jgi:cytochrome d ubiquinol oxidase subunit I